MRWPRSPPAARSACRSPTWSRRSAGTRASGGASRLWAALAARGMQAEFAASREALIARLAAEARRGDLVLVMGARDPSLTTLAREVLSAIDSAGMVAEARRA